MQIHIRAEDFAYGDGYLDLGGRVVQGSSILSSAVQRRTSAELIWMALAIVGAIWALTTQISEGAKLAISLFLLVLAAGAVRELRHNYVATMNIYQIGQFEVRGMTKQQAVEMQDVLDAVRSGPKAKPFFAA